LQSLTYSIVIPAYNESARIASTLERIMAFASERRWNVEVIVVDDGSTDATSGIVRDYAAKHPQLRQIENPGNRGKGYSVRNGMLHAQGDLLLFSDADLSSPITEAPKLFDAIGRGADIVIGSRWLKPDLQTQRQPPRRQFFGRIFNLLLRMVLGLHFKDTQCGFKAFTRSAAAVVFPLQNVERWGFDPELLYIAKHFGLRVVEVPVVWAHREGTHIHPLRDGLRMFRDVLRIRWNGFTGKYDAGRAVSEPS
jgi:dolichyl-phosphate beta-glucosyltransferase